MEVNFDTLLGITGTIIGTVVGSLTSIFRDWLQQRPNQQLAKTRKKLLTSMLKHKLHTWRSLSLLSHVIGADEDTTKCLLIQIGARASSNLKDKWGLISRNPLPDEFE